MRAAAGWNDMQGAKFCRFGDNMRQVAVTDGDKVEAEIKFGYAVNGYGIGDLVKVINEVSESAIDVLIKEYQDRYTIAASLKTSPKPLREACKDRTRPACFFGTRKF